MVELYQANQTRKALFTLITFNSSNGLAQIGTSIYLFFVPNGFNFRAQCLSPAKSLYFPLGQNIRSLLYSWTPFPHYYSCAFHKTTNGKRGGAHTHAKSIVFASKYTTKNHLKNISIKSWRMSQESRCMITASWCLHLPFNTLRTRRIQSVVGPFFKTDVNFKMG